MRKGNGGSGGADAETFGTMPSETDEGGCHYSQWLDLAQEGGRSYRTVWSNISIEVDRAATAW